MNSRKWINGYKRYTNSKESERGAKVASKSYPRGRRGGYESRGGQSHRRNYGGEPSSYLGDPPEGDPSEDEPGITAIMDSPETGNRPNPSIEAFRRPQRINQEIQLSQPDFYKPRRARGHKVYIQEEGSFYFKIM